MLSLKIILLMRDMETKVVFYLPNENITITSVIEKDKVVTRRWSYSTTAIKVANFRVKLTKPSKPNRFHVRICALGLYTFDVFTTF